MFNYMMMYLYTCIVSYMLNTWIYISGFWATKDKGRVEPFDSGGNGIQILYVQSQCGYTNIDNILRYLKHHIMITHDTFDKIDFEFPIKVTYTYIGGKYEIWLTRLKSHNSEQLDIIREPMFLSVSVDGVYDKDITNRLNQLHGPTSNFYAHIPDAVSINHVLYSIIGNNKKITTFDMLGIENIIII